MKEVGHSPVYKQSPESKFSRLVKFPSQDLDLAPVEILKGTEVMRSRAVSQG